MNLEEFFMLNIDRNEAQLKRIWELYFSASVGIYSGALHREGVNVRIRESICH
jgi:hypothetical protein